MEPFLMRELSTGLRAMESARAATCSARRAQSIVFGFAPATTGTNAMPARADTTPTICVRFLEGWSGMSSGLIGPWAGVLSQPADEALTRSAALPNLIHPLQIRNGPRWAHLRQPSAGR